MPSSAELLSRCSILRTNDGRATNLPAADTYVASDARSYVLYAPLLDLHGQEWIGNGWPRSSDDVQVTCTNDLDHLFRIGKASDAQHRLLRCIPRHFEPGHQVALTIEA